MRPYVLQLIPHGDVILLEKIRKAVGDLPEINFGVDDKDRKIVMSCHILARALAKTFSLRYVDGYLYPSFQHSWLITTTGNIIDPYPVATLGGPILISGDSSSPAKWLYKSNKRINAKRYFSTSWFRRAVRRTVRTLKEILTD